LQLLQTLPLYDQGNYKLSAEAPETVGPFREQHDETIRVGWEMRVPERGPDGVPFQIIFPGPTADHRGVAIRLRVLAKDGAEVVDDCEVTLETYYKTGSERTLVYQGAIEDQHAPNAAVSVQRRAEAGEDYIIRLTLSVPSGRVEPDPAAFESWFEIDCTKLWWFESA
jgi:hypothetical protein